MNNDLQDASDSLTSHLPLIVQGVFFLGIAYRSLQHSVKQYPHESVERELQKNVSQFLESLRGLDAPELLQLRFAKLLQGATIEPMQVDMEELLVRMDQFALKYLFDWLGVLDPQSLAQSLAVAHVTKAKPSDEPDRNLSGKSS